MSNELNDGYWFKSPLFEVVLGEDKNTNPFCYGKQQSSWIKDQLTDLGYSVEGIIEEDWGFSVVCQKEPYSVSVGCGNIRSDFYETVDEQEYENFVPDKNSIIWYCFPNVEVSFLKRLFGKKESSDSLNKLKNDLKTILSREQEIILVERP